MSLEKRNTDIYVPLKSSNLENLQADISHRFCSSGCSCSELPKQFMYFFCFSLSSLGFVATTHVKYSNFRVSSCFLKKSVIINPTIAIKLFSILIYLCGRKSCFPIFSKLLGLECFEGQQGSSLTLLHDFCNCNLTMSINTAISLL